MNLCFLYKQGHNHDFLCEKPKKSYFFMQKSMYLYFHTKKVWIFTSLYKNILNHYFFPTNLFFFVWKSKKKKFLIHKSVLHYICILEVQLFWRTVPCKCIHRTCMSLLLFFCRSTWRTGIYSWLMSSASLGLEWCNPGYI